jgi:hypothetical protein
MKQLEYAINFLSFISKLLELQKWILELKIVTDMSVKDVD